MHRQGRGDKKFRKRTVSLPCVILLLAAGGWAIGSCQERGSTSPAEPAFEHVDTASCTDWAEFRVGEYLLENNVWGKGTIEQYSQCMFAVRNDSGFRCGWEWSWPHGSGFDVKAYPEIIFGWKPWRNESTTAGLPARIGNLRVQAAFELREASIVGTGNLAFDLWITDTLIPNPGSIRHEVMIWVKNSGQAAGGTLTDTVMIDGSSYAFYKAAWDWNYFAFVKQSQEEVTVLNIDRFLSHLVIEGLVSPNEYLASIEFGNEIVAGTGRTEIRDYAIRVERQN